MKYELTAKRLQKALSDNNMSAQDLSNASGVSKASISQYVNGSHKPSNISSAKIGHILNINPLWLMGFNVEPAICASAEKDMTKQIYDSNTMVRPDYVIRNSSGEPVLVIEAINNACCKEKYDNLLKLIAELPTDDLDKVIDMLNVFVKHSK